MLVGTLCPLYQVDRMHRLAEGGFEFIEIVAPHNPQTLPEFLPSVPRIWACPPDLPMEHPAAPIRAAVLVTWRQHLAAAQKLEAALMVIQFRRPLRLEDKVTFIQQSVELLAPITQEGRAVGVQVVLRNSPDNRDQLQLLREIVRNVPGLGVALDVAYTYQGVVKNLMNEYLWDSDLAPRLAHLYASDSDGKNADLRLPLGSLGLMGWPRLVSDLRERYNASVTLDVGEAAPDYLALSRTRWLNWWHATPQAE